MSAYVVVDTIVKDAEAKQRYSAAAGPIVRQFGGEFVAGGAWTNLAGGSRFSNGAIIRFESPERALEWYNSEDYQATLADREAGLESRFRLMG